MDQVFSTLHTTIKIIEEELQLGATVAETFAVYDGYSSFIESWCTFKNRFSNYYPFLNCLPFYDQFQQIAALIPPIDLFIQDDGKQNSLFKDLAIFDKMTAMEYLLSETKKYGARKS